MYVPYPMSHLLPHPHFIPRKREKARIRATRTMTRLIHAASAGTASASYLRPFLRRARGVARVAGQAARVKAAAHSSGRCPHSSLHKRRPRRRRQCRRCLAAILHVVPQGCRDPTHKLGPCPCRMEQCLLQARPLSCQVIHVSADGCAGSVVGVARRRS